jgi:hypothetical protein
VVVEAKKTKKKDKVASRPPAPLRDVGGESPVAQTGSEGVAG